MLLREGDLRPRTRRLVRGVVGVVGVDSRLTWGEGVSRD